MSLDDWILALHLLSAFALGGAIVLFWVVTLAMRATDLADATAGLGRVARVGRVAVGVGIFGTLFFGIWLAISLDAYQVWDGWVLAAIALWAIGSETGRRAGEEYDRATTRAGELVAAGHTGSSTELASLNRSATALVLQTVSTIAVVLILIDMIWKPGA